MSGETTKQKARIYLALPNYDGNVNTGAATTLIHALSSGEGSTTQPVGHTFHRSSALCYNYNTLWADFMTQFWPDGADAFAMLHSDLEVVGHPYWDQRRSWLDWMWDTMQYKGLNCLSVVNAIKSREGHTSVAMGAGEWGQRRLSFRDLAALPPTFDNEEFKNVTGMTLLVNTGIMLIKPDAAWAHEFEFTFGDRIVQDASGKKFAMMAPEDWNMSRFFHNRNVRYGATTEVRTLHHGIMSFPNWDAGDGLYLPETQVQEHTTGIFEAAK